MWQWMGGSRRKVTASRNSTLKRQKQYFEQRKKQAAVLESSSNGYACEDFHKEQRSLDVLSFLNLSTVAQECRSLSLDVKEKLEVGASGVNHNINAHQPIAFGHDVPSETCQLEEAGSQSINQVKIQSSKKACPNLLVDHKNRCNRNNSLHDHWSISENELSVLELLCGEGLQDSGRSQIHEDHVSFSVEGIGKVAAESPVHSPQRPRRMRSYDYPSPLKAAKQPRSYENLSSDLELEVDAIMQNIDASLGENTLELPSYSRSRRGSFSSQRQKLYNLEDLMQLDDHTSKVKSSFTNRKILYRVDDVEQHIYDAGCGFHNDGFLHKSRRVMLPRDSPSQVYDKTITKTVDFPFDESYQYNKRFSMAAKKTRNGFPILDSTAPYHKFSGRESNINFLADLPRDNLQSGSYLAAEDARDSLISLSFDNEELCTSNAAWERTCSTFNSAENQCIRRPGDKFISRNYGKGSLNTNDLSSEDSLKLWESARGSGKYTKISNHSISKPSHRFSLHNNIESGISWLFEEEYPSAELSSGINTYCQTPYTKYSSSVSNIQSHEFGAYSDPELEMNIKTTSQKICPDDSLEYSHSGFLSKEPLFCQSFDDVLYRNLFVKPDKVCDSVAPGPLPVESDMADFHKSREFLDFSVSNLQSREFGAYSDPELEMNKTMSQKFCPDDALQYSHSGFLSKELLFCQSFDDVQCRNLFAKPDTVSDSEAQGPNPVASNMVDFHENQEFLDFSLGKKKGRDQGKEREIQTSDDQKNQPGKEFTTGNEALSLEDENELGASEGKDSKRGCQEASISTSQSRERTPCSHELAVKTSSSSVMIPDNSVSSDNRRECQDGGEGSVKCPNGEPKRVASPEVMHLNK